VPAGTENAALVALLRIGRRPWHVYAALVEEAESALPVLDEELASMGAQPSLFATEPQPDLDAIASQITRWEAAGMRLVSVLDREYPDNLRAVHDRPPLVFVAGRLTPGDARSVAVVGARTASPAGTAAAVAIAEHLVDRGYCVVSGLAAGIDAAAHNAALGRGGRTVAMIGTGLRRVYPPENAPLQRQIAAACAVVSQFWPDAPPTKRSFPMRNAVMSGFALGTVLVEASLTSGSRIQARLALEHGRPVFLLDSLLEHDWARSFAARPGAYVVRTPSDITTVVERLTGKTALTGS
jgi:DNA processing protein